MSMIEKVSDILRLVNGEKSAGNGSASLPEDWEAQLASKQDVLTAGDGILINNNVISLEDGEFVNLGPPNFSDNAQQYGWYGTLAMVGAEDPQLLLKTISIYRRQGGTINGGTPLYLRVLRKNEGGAWHVAYQSTHALTMNSFLLESEEMMWTVENVDGSPNIPTDEPIFICFVSDTSAAANTGVEVGFKPTTVYTGVYNMVSPFPLTPSDPYTFGMALHITGMVKNEQVLWENVLGRPETFPPETHTHSIEDVNGLQEALESKQAALTPGDNITIAADGTISATGGGSDEGGGMNLEAVKDWVNGQGTDEDGNIERTNLNNRGTSISDTKYVSDGGTITDILASVTNEGVTPAQIQSIVDATGNVGISSNITTVTNTGVQATVRARHINQTSGTITQAALVAGANGEAKVVVADSTGTLTMTPISIESGQGSRVVLGSSDAQCAVIANEAAPYIVLRTGDIDGSNEENLSLFVNQDVTGGPALQLNGQRGTTDLRDNSWTLTSGDAQIKLETSENGTVKLTLTDNTGSLTLTPSSVLGGNTGDSGSTGNYLPLTGGELTGSLTFPSTTGLSRTTTVAGDAITLSGVGATPVSFKMTPFGLQLINSTTGAEVVAEIGLDTNIKPFFKTTKTSAFADEELIPKSYVDTAISDVLGDINTLLESI